MTRMSDVPVAAEVATGSQYPPRSHGDYWEALVGARTAEQLCVAWLPILAGNIQVARGALLLLKEADGSYVPAAVWPEGAVPDHLRGVAEEALSSRRGAFGRSRDGYSEVAYPLVSGDELLGAVILDLESIQDEQVAGALRQLHWGAGWLLDLHNRRETARLRSSLERSAALFDLMLATLAESDPEKAALTVVNHLARRFGCHQVQFGIERGNSIGIEAISHSAWYDEKANLLNLAASAMNEAFDQRAAITLPENGAGTSALIDDAHRRYAEESRCGALFSMPLVAGSTVVGVWLFERDEPFTAEEHEAIEATALALAPVMQLQQRQNESLWAHVKRGARHALSRIGDSTYPGVKLILAGTLLLIALLAIITIDHRVGAPAVVEGAVQRSAVAPFDGFIESAPARAGDVVSKGQLLARLDDKDLTLERARWQAEYEVAQRKTQEAMAKGDRVELRLASAQADQAEAQLNLVLEKLARVSVVAPFDGVVVRGDLSQEIGSPVEQGKVLFEISPLAEWRVIARVDERDIGYVREGMSGELMLTSLPTERFQIVVGKVTPVATAEDGRNYFRVETRLAVPADALRPNMEGVAKISAGERSVLWIWTHRLSDWLRVALWKAMP